LEGLSISSTSGILSLATIGLVIFFVILFVSFIIWELRAEQPIMDFGLFRSGAFTAPVFGIFVLGGATSLGFIVPPYFLEQVLYLEAWKAGLVNLSAPLGLVLLSKVSGRFIDRVGTTYLMMLGLITMAAAYGILSMIHPNWAPILIAALLLIYGFGAGLFVPPNTSAIMGAVGRDSQGTIGAVQRMVQNLGIALFSAITAAFIYTHSNAGVQGWMVGFREAWLFGAASLLVSLIMFVFLLKKDRHKETEKT